MINIEIINWYFISNADQFMCIACPKNSDQDRIYPNCSCSKIGAYDTYNNECTQCVKGSTGIYPNCSCVDEYATFHSYRNICEYCPEGSKGKMPDCICDDGAGLLMKL